MEDTDRKRSTEEAVSAIVDGLTWLNLDWDDEIVRQSERMERHAVVAQRLLQEGKAYHCYCSREELDAMRAEQRTRGLKPRYDGRCRNRLQPPPGVAPAVRFKTPDHGEVRVIDRVRGEVAFDNAELDDLVILRSDGVPTYNFSVVVDDGEMRITHVVRGDDHLNNTPRQLHIMAALGIAPPEYAHVPMILGPDGGRLSKRHGAVDVLTYKETGYLPEAVLNYIVRLGWAHGDQEIFALDEMIGAFDLEQVNESAASFDPDKLLWVNAQWLKRAPAGRLAQALTPFLLAAGVEPGGGPPLAELVEIQRDRAPTLLEMADKSLFVYRAPQTYAPKAAKQHLRPGSLAALEQLRAALGRVRGWTVESTQEAVEAVAEQLDLRMGRVAQPLRVAVTGDSASPGIGQTLFLLGREQTLLRLEKAIEFVSALPR